MAPTTGVGTQLCIQGGLPRDGGAPALAVGRVTDPEMCASKFMKSKFMVNVSCVRVCTHTKDSKAFTADGGWWSTHRPGLSQPCVFRCAVIAGRVRAVPLLGRSRTDGDSETRAPPARAPPPRRGRGAREGVGSVTPTSSPPSHASPTYRTFPKTLRWHLERCPRSAGLFRAPRVHRDALDDAGADPAPGPARRELWDMTVACWSVVCDVRWKKRKA